MKFEERTLIFFEAPHRILETLAVAKKYLGADRGAALCREMTKTYEETVRGSIQEIENWAKSKEVLGEITMVISGAPVGEKEISQSELVMKVQKLESVGMDRKEAISAVAKELDIPKREVFDAMIAAKDSSKN